MTLPADQLGAAARGPLARWLTARRREIVSIRVAAAQNHVAAATAMLKRLADKWADDAGAMPGSDRIHWDQIDRADLTYTLDDILEGEYGARFSKSYPLSKDALLDILDAWRQGRATSEAGMVELWTDAPKDYDHEYARRTGETFYSPGLQRTYHRVLVPQERVQYQAMRYQSGLHAAWDKEGIEKERAYAAKATRKAEFKDTVKALRAKLDAIRDLIPAKYENGYWQLGVRNVTKYTQDGHSYQGSVEIPYGSLDPARAAREAAEVTQAFNALPEDMQKEEWRIGADATDLARIAQREAKRLDEERTEKARQAAEKASTREKRINAFVAYVDKKYPRPVGMIFSTGDAQSRGRLLSWPPVDGVVQTDLGPVDISSVTPAYNRDGALTGFTAGLYKAPDVPIPTAVWKAGAPTHADAIEVNYFGSTPVYSWMDPAKYGTKIVVDAEGRKVPKNSKMYATAMKAATMGDESQDSLIDRTLTETLTNLGKPEPGHPYPVTFTTRDGRHVQHGAFIAPVGGGKGLVGYVVYWRGASDSQMYRTSLIREARTTKDRPYLWRVLEQREVLPTETLYVARQVGEANQDKAARLLINEPTLSIDPLALLKALKPGDKIKVQRESGWAPGPATVLRRRGSSVDVEWFNGAPVTLDEDSTVRGQVNTISGGGTQRVTALEIVPEAP